MRTRVLGWIVVAALSAAPAAARAAILRGFAGLQYTRDDSFEPVATTVPTFALDLSLSLGGFLSDPRLLTYDLTGAYQRYQVMPQGGDGPTREQAKSTRDVFNYAGRATLFGHKASAFTLSGFADRREESIAAGLDSSYSSLSRTFGGDARVNLPGRHLSLSYSRGDTAADVPNVGNTESKREALSASIGQGAENYSYGLAYSIDKRAGTFAGDNSDEHRLDVTGKADLSTSTAVQFQDNFYRRLPTVESPFNPRQETNSLQLITTAYVSPREYHQGGYSYIHGLQIAPASDDIERQSHALDYSYGHTLANPEWQLIGTFDTRYNEARVGDATSRAAGQTVGGTASWRRSRPESMIEIRGGPSVGLTEPDSGPLAVGYGAGAGTTYMHMSAWTWQLGYNVAFGSSILADAGWSFSQSVFASAETALGLGHLSANLTGSSERRNSPVFGAGATRTVNGRIAYTRGPAGVSIFGGVSSGLSNAVAVKGGDGLFLSLPYDTSTYNAGLSAGLRLLENLTASADAQTTTIDQPDRPKRTDAIMNAALTYGYGALSLSLEDHYVMARNDAGQFRANRVMVVARRSFGTRF